MAVLREVAVRNLQELLEAREGLVDAWIVRYHGLAISFADGAPCACRVDQATRFTLVDAGAMAAPNGQAIHTREAIEASINRLEKFLAQQG